MSAQDADKNKSAGSGANNRQDDQRYIPRWEVQNRITYQLHNEQDVREGRSRDLSCAGICLQTDHDLSSQDKIKLTVQLAKNKSVAIKGKILWTKKIPAGHLNGIIFENIAPEVQDLILDYAFEIKRQDVVKHWFKGWDDDR